MYAAGRIAVSSVQEDLHCLTEGFFKPPPPHPDQEFLQLCLLANQSELLEDFSAESPATP